MVILARGRGGGGRGSGSTDQGQHIEAVLARTLASIPDLAQADEATVLAAIARAGVPSSSALTAQIKKKLATARAAKEEELRREAQKRSQTVEAGPAPIRPGTVRAAVPGATDAKNTQA